MKKLLIAAFATVALMATALPAQASVTVGLFRADATASSPLWTYFFTDTVGDLHVHLNSAEKGFTASLVARDGSVSCSMHSNRYREAFCTIPNAPVGTYDVYGVPDGSKVMDISGWLTGELVFDL